MSQLTDSEKLKLIQQQIQELKEIRSDSDAQKDTHIIRRVQEREEELKELKSQFITITSHEFRTPLAIISSSAHLLQKYGSNVSEEVSNKHLNKIKQNVVRIAAMLEDLLLLSHLQVQNIPVADTVIPISQLAQMLIEGYQNRYNATHQFDFTSNPPDIHIVADHTIIELALNHLVKNAVAYTVPSGHISVKLSLTASHFVMEVSDDGIGIPLENQENIFDSFVRGSNVSNIPGIGLGLAIVRDIVISHNGTINLDSHPSKTTFTVTLPQ